MRKTVKLTENANIRKAIAIHWRDTTGGQPHWLIHWGWQTCTQANILAALPLTSARDKHWWSHCRSLGPPDMSTSLFARQLKKGAVNLPYTPVFSIDTVNSEYWNREMKQPKTKNKLSSHTNKICTWPHIFGTVNSTPSWKQIKAGRVQREKFYFVNQNKP